MLIKLSSKVTGRRVFLALSNGGAFVFLNLLVGDISEKKAWLSL